MMWRHVEAMVEQARRWDGWPRTRSLGVLGISRTAYYRWRRRAVSPGATATDAPARPRSPHALLAEERAAVLRYARENPSPRHRELAWKMVDDGAAFVSPSAVYRILREKNLVPRWPPRRQKRRCEENEKAQRPDERWQSDIRYVKIGRRRYYGVIFIDEYSRQAVHGELMTHLDGDTLSLEAQRAIEKLPSGRKPIIQTDNGSGYISQEFKKVLSENGLGHVRIRPHCPEENGLVERLQRTLGEPFDAAEPEDLEAARVVFQGIIRWYNEERLHSALHFLRPVDYYRGEPEKLLEERRRTMAAARHRRRERNLEVTQPTLPFETVDTEAGHSLLPEPFCAG